MKDGQISIVIPVYNGEKDILYCISSILKQTRLSLIKEIIIINDGSTDNTENIIQEIKKATSTTLKLINQKNLGVSVARNRGIEIALGEWIAFLDSDDEWVNNKLELQEGIIDKYNPIMTAGNIRNTSQIIGLIKSGKIIKVNPLDMMIRSFPQTSTVMIKKKVFNEIMFNEDQSHSEDLNLFTKVCYKYDYYHLNEQLVVYGNNKNQFAKHNGLSSNIKLMNKGAKRNLYEFYKLGIIRRPFYYCLIIFNEIKYIRRILRSIIAKKSIKEILNK